MNRTFAVAILLSAALPLTAQAHAMLDRSDPAVGSTLATAPRQIVLTFTQDLEPAFSQVEVRGENGALVSAKAQAAAGSHAQLRVPLKPLSPGLYKVIWHVLSVDTHRSEGNFTFRVAP